MNKDDGGNYVLWFFGILIVLGLLMNPNKEENKTSIPTSRPSPSSSTYSYSRYASAEATAQIHLTEDAQDAQIAVWEARETAACDIKGNITFDGEKIYHLPGQKYYNATEINPNYGERYFCTEAEARAAGWRKSQQ